eukprot:5128850-Prymnesium_polylepis.1
MKILQAWLPHAQLLQARPPPPRDRFPPACVAALSPPQLQRRARAHASRRPCDCASPRGATARRTRPSAPAHACRAFARRCMRACRR